MPPRAEDEPALRLEGVRRVFRAGKRQVVALDGLSAEAARGAVTGLIGPDGAGKTTLMRLIAGLLRLDAGRIEALGVDVARDPLAVQARIGYMPQRFGLYEDLSVQQNLDLYADLQGVPAAERPARYAELLHMTALGPFTGRRAGRLSGGMKQKLGLACTLLRTPELLLLDEPTVGVDPVSRRELWQIIDHLTRDSHATVLFSTAYLDEAERCDMVLLLHEGRLVNYGPPGDFTARSIRRSFYASRRGRPAAAAGAARARAGGRRRRDPGQPRARGDRRGRAARGGGAGPRPAGTDLRPHRAALRRQLRRPCWATVTRTRAPPPRARARSIPRLSPRRAARTSLRSTASRAASATSSPSTTSASALRAARFSVCSAPTARANRPRSACSAACCRPPGARFGVAGFDLRTAAAPARARIGYMAQKFSLYSDLSVMRNLRFFSSVYGLYGARQRARIDWAVGEFDLAEQLESPRAICRSVSSSASPSPAR